jgi:hypothetical protein
MHWSQRTNRPHARNLLLRVKLNETTISRPFPLSLPLPSPSWHSPDFKNGQNTQLYRSYAKSEEVRNIVKRVIPAKKKNYTKFKNEKRNKEQQE